MGKKTGDVREGVRARTKREGRERAIKRGFKSVGALLKPNDSRASPGPP